MTDAPPTFTPTPHPVLELPGPAQVARMSDAQLIEFYAAREEAIAQERENPMAYGYEPPVWTICDALLGLPWAEEDWKRRGWEGTARAYRESLGFEYPVDVLLILGGNRAGKSQYAARTRGRYIQWFKDKIIWAFHSTLTMSRDTQQALDYFYMPAAWTAKDIKTRWTYIAYKKKTGFSDEFFIAPTFGECHYKSYDQDQDKAIQGPEVDLATPDELVPASWVKDLELRIATRRGKIIVTFTPREGYSDTVAMFLDGAVPVRETVAYLLPKDGGPPEPWSALGLTKEEFDHLWAVERKNEEEKTNLAPWYPQSRPEEFVLGGTGVAPVDSRVSRESSAGTAARDAQQNGPEGRATREFERVPRILRCSDPKRAVIFFHGRDNPYGNPKQVIRNTQAGTIDWIKECNYGVAKKTVGAALVNFDWNVHTIPADQVPPPAMMTIYNLWDPHGVARNYAGLWVGVTPEHAYVFREFPGNYYIPDIGVPGPWALPGSKKHPDGLPGPGQRSFGWGHVQYKKEIARLEKWPSVLQTKPHEISEEQWVIGWDQWQKREEWITERALDARFAMVPKMQQSNQRDEPVTLLSEYDNIGLTFERTRGDDVDSGVRDIEAALYYNTKEPVSFHNAPYLLVSRECLNTIFALQIWTGLEKDRGATCEWIFLLRSFFRGGYATMGGLRQQEAEEENNEWNEEGVYR